MQLSAATIAEHLRIEPTEADSATVRLYEGAAWEYVQAVTRRTWTDVATVPFSVISAVLLLIGDAYENREAQSPVVLRENRAVERLLWPHRLF